MPHDGRLGQCCCHVTAPSIRAGAVVLLAPRGGANSTPARSPKRGARGAPKGDAKERRANGPAYRDLSDRLFEPERLEELLRGYLDQAIDGQARVKEKLRQAREARGDVEAKISRLLGPC